MAASGVEHSGGADLPEALLALPAARAIPAGLRSLLRGAAQGDAAVLREPLRDPLPVLVDTLGSLALLNADGDVVAATMLHALPGWSERAEPALAKDYPAVALLLEGQRAAVQVWALHAERSGAALRRDAQQVAQAGRDRAGPGQRQQRVRQIRAAGMLDA